MGVWAADTGAASAVCGSSGSELLSVFGPTCLSESREGVFEFVVDGSHRVTHPELMTGPRHFHSTPEGIEEDCHHDLPKSGRSSSTTAGSTGEFTDDAGDSIVRLGASLWQRFLNPSPWL